MMATNPDLTPATPSNPFDDAPTSKHVRLSDDLGDLLAEPELDDFDDDDDNGPDTGTRKVG